MPVAEGNNICRSSVCGVLWRLGFSRFFGFLVSFAFAFSLVFSFFLFLVFFRLIDELGPVSFLVYLRGTLGRFGC